MVVEKPEQDTKEVRGEIMEFPIKCMSCGQVIGHLWEPYRELINKGKTPEEAFEALGIKRYCCRRMFVGYVELNKEVLPYRRE